MTDECTTDEQTEDIVFTHDVRVSPSYDYRDVAGDSRGCGGAEMRFLLIGPKGALEGNLRTGWMHRPLAEPYPGNEWSKNPDRKLRRREKPGFDHPTFFSTPAVRLRGDNDPVGNYVQYHAADRMFEFDEHGPLEDCDVLPGGTCWFDRGYLMGDDFLDALVGGGTDAAWKYLEQLYRDRFESTGEES